MFFLFCLKSCSASQLLATGDAEAMQEKCVAIYNLFQYPIVLDWIELSADLHEFKDIESCLSKKGR